MSAGLGSIISSPATGMSSLRAAIGSNARGYTGEAKYDLKKLNCHISSCIQLQKTSK